MPWRLQTSKRMHCVARAHPLREWWDEHYGFALAVAIAILSLGTVLLVEWWRS
jgi:hypothetical protein